MISIIGVSIGGFIHSKVLVIGDYGVGKTSLIRRYTEGYFSPNYKLTIGVDFALKTVEGEDGKKVALQLWDIAGHERFGHMTVGESIFGNKLSAHFECARCTLTSCTPFTAQLDHPYFCVLSFF